MKGRILALGALLALCALLLTACGRGGVKSEKEIMADILEKGVMDVMAVSDVPIEEISSLKILKRQTNKELKNDFVYVTVEADTETAHFVRSMKLTYNYYDDQGWLLDEYERSSEGENNTTPKKAPNERALDNFFSRFSMAHCGEYRFVEYSSWTLDDVTADLENCEATMQVTASRETECIKTTESLTMTAYFMPDSCSWVIEGDSIEPYLTELSYEWKIEPGVYTANDEWMSMNFEYCLTINEINIENNTISLSLESNGNIIDDGVYKLEWEKLNGVDIQEAIGTGANLDTMQCFVVSATLDERSQTELHIIPCVGMYVSFWSHSSVGNHAAVFIDER